MANESIGMVCLSPTCRTHGRRRLSVLQAEAATCTKCDLHPTRGEPAFGRGNPSADLVFIGEMPPAPGDKWPALLDKMVAAMGYRPDDVYLCHAMKCRSPENRKPEPKEMAACLPFLEEQILAVKPRAIVTMGATATQALVGMSSGITRERGNWKFWRGIPVMVTFHPAYLLRDPTKKREAWGDLQQVMRVVKKATTPEAGAMESR